MIGTWLPLLILTFLGSAMGGLCRHLLTGWIDRRANHGFPWGTLAVNTTGAFAVGMVWGLPWEVWPPVSALGRDFLVFGFLGGYTTVSSFALNTLDLWQNDCRRRAVFNLFGTHALCLTAVFTGAAVVL